MLFCANLHGCLQLEDNVKERNCFKLLPNDTILDESKFKAFAGDRLYVAQKLKYVLERVENNVANGKNAGNQHFLHFPQCFQKLSFLGSLKVGIVW